MGTEIQDFAAELSGLKERSGLSYGALAQRLHMSTSTVHRYCNGDAVPHDYAPVERFARVCRASADELVGLHRKWILADEAKRRGARKPEAAVTADPRPVPSEDVAPRSEPEPEPASEPEPEPAPAPESETESVLGVEPEAGDVTPPQELRSSADAPTPGRRPSRRLRVLVAAVAVVALTVPAALAVRGLTDDDGSGGGRAEAATGTVSAASSVSPSPSPSRSGSPSATPSRSVSPSAGASTGGTPSASARVPARQGGEADDRGVPVSAVISSYNWESPCGQYYMLDREPGTVPPPPPPQDSRSWAKALGGVDGGDMLLELTLQGASQEAVVLKGLHVRIVGHEPALAWTAYSMGEGCGSGITPQSFDIDLDGSRPRAQPVAGQAGGVVVPAKDFPYRVSSTDVEVFNLDAHVEGHNVTWYLELEWSSGGRSGTLRIDDNGKPFRTSSMTGRPEYRYRTDTAQWVKPDY